MLEYSLRNKVSLSTLRRRIKSKVIEYKMEAGRYLIMDSESNNYASGADIYSGVPQMLIQELKKAYGAVLSEKEEMISQLKQEIEDLRKINQLLEKEIDRISETRSKPRDLLDL
jgi:hypothetical protein